MDKEEVGLVKLEIIEKLLTMWKEGSALPIDHKQEDGSYSFASFMKESQEILKTMGAKIIVENEFIDKFIPILIEYKNK